MTPKQVQIIKKDQIHITGTVQLSPEAETAFIGSQFPAEKTDIKQARIIESNQSYAILEVVCGCGCRSRIQCDYVNA